MKYLASHISRYNGAPELKRQSHDPDHEQRRPDPCRSHTNIFQTSAVTCIISTEKKINNITASFFIEHMRLSCIVVKIWPSYLLKVDFFYQDIFGASVEAGPLEFHQCLWYQKTTFPRYRAELCA